MIEILAALAFAGAMFCFVVGLFWDFGPDQRFPDVFFGNTERWIKGPQDD